MSDHPPIDPGRLDANWRAITIELDAPRPSRLERLLRVARVPSTMTRLVAATPALRRSWYLSVGAVVLIGLSIADPSNPDSLLALLILAPMLPVLGVALAYGTAADPSHEIQVATPTSGLRVVIVRATVVIAVSAAVVIALSLANEAARPQAAAWLLPAVAVTASSLAAMTVVAPRRATMIVAVVWFVVVLGAREAAGDPLAAFRLGGQVAAVVATAAAVTVVAVRRDRFDELELAA